MAKAKKGDLFTCELCGLVVAVDENCDCVVGELICCDIPMEKGKAKMKKAAKPAKKAKTPAKAKKVKAAPKKAVKPAKKAAKPEGESEAREGEEGSEDHGKAQGKGQGKGLAESKKESNGFRMTGKKKPRSVMERGFFLISARTLPVRSNSLTNAEISFIL